METGIARCSCGWTGPVKDCVPAEFTRWGCPKCHTAIPEITQPPKTLGRDDEIPEHFKQLIIKRVPSIVKDYLENYWINDPVGSREFIINGLDSVDDVRQIKILQDEIDDIQKQQKDQEATAEIKPCPFCGSPTYPPLLQHNLSEEFYKIDCDDCGVQVRLSDNTDKQKLVDAWNKRKC